MKRRASVRFAMMAVAAIIAVVFSPAAATACQIDNDHDRLVSFWFDCGIACGNYFDDVLPGKSVSRPGKSGHVEAGVFTSALTWDCDKNGVPIGAHGEVGVRYERYDKAAGPYPAVFTWASKGKNSWSGLRDGAASVVDSHRCWHGSP